MSGHLVTKYVKLTETIAVPEEWPVRGLQKFLVPLIEQVIKESNAGKSVVLQILNQPAMLVQRQNRYGMQYFFDKVFTEELMGSYVIDVILDTNHKDIHTMDRFSLDDYTVKVCQSEYRTTYYLLPAAQCVPMKLTQCHDRQKESNGRTNSNLTFLLAIVGIPSLPYWTSNKFTVVPSTWISYHESQTMVSYPMLQREEFSRHVNHRKPPCQTWQIFPVTVEYKTNTYDDAVCYVQLREEMRSSYIRSIPQQFEDGIQFVDLQFSTYTSAIPSNGAENSYTVTTNEIVTKAIKDDLVARITDRINEINRLLDQYSKIQCKR